MADLFKNGNETVKMLDFVTSLYKKYKVLNRLSQQESKTFQQEIVSLLVDSHQNVDKETFEDINSNIGFPSFLLQLLGNVVNRNPFKNQFELNRNLDIIAENIKKQQQDLLKRQKIIERKEVKLKQVQDQLTSTLKQKISLMEADSVKKISLKQSEIKKNLNTMLSQLKAKQRIILQKWEQIKSNKSVLAQLQEKEKTVNDKIKLLERKEKETKNKETESEVKKKEGKFALIEEENKSLRNSLKEVSSKLKNLEMAYRKIKNEKQKLQKDQKIEPDKSNTNSSPSNHKLQCASMPLDNLELSVIHHKVEQTTAMNTLILQQKLNSILSCISSQAQKAKIQLIIDSILPSQQPQQTSVQEIQKLANSESISFLEEEQQSQDPYQQMIKQIKSISFEGTGAKEKFINSDLLKRIFQQLSEFRYPLSVCSEVLELMLPLMEMDQEYELVVGYLFQTSITTHLQKIYLSHQTTSDIAETSTLILSRVKLWKGKLQLLDPFKKAIQLRRRVQTDNTILCLNLKYLLE